MQKNTAWANIYALVVGNWQFFASFKLEVNADEWIIGKGFALFKQLIVQLIFQRHKPYKFIQRNFNRTHVGKVYPLDL